MFKTKHIILGFILFLVAFSSLAFAEGPTKVLIDGNEVDLIFEPTAIHGRSIIPIRFIARSLGLDLDSNIRIDSIESQKDDKNIESLNTIDSNLIYEYNKELKYSIYTSKIIDTYLIASALYLDFDSQIIMPSTDQHELYRRAKEYFLPYKDHDFIKNFNNYVFYNDINGDAIGILLSCSNSPDLKPTHEFQPQYRNWIFRDEKEIEKFLSQLRSFYIDTNAEEFFKQNSDLYAAASNYIKDNIENTEVINLFKETEKYLGNKSKYYSGDNIEYKTLITLFRPSMASFYSIRTDKGALIISFQSPNDFSRNPEKFDINNTVSNTLHETLHSYINPTVASNESLISELTVFKEKQDYAHQMYQSMPWNRIVDENFVRAIQGRIYKNVLGEERAMNEIIDIQIKYGGFKNLKSIYDKLDEYEKDRERYPMIDDFIPKLIKELFK
ncbi:DUF4932 domain-containing protein [Wukongibacter baidiensis]|uniref:DUF4932 domain-containing protein n=1 Tax=Wukongibacter baidiensis TaxID=1723361 RepID=UPI003D7F3707